MSITITQSILDHLDKKVENLIKENNNNKIEIFDYRKLSDEEERNLYYAIQVNMMKINRLKNNEIM